MEELVQAGAAPGALVRTVPEVAWAATAALAAALKLLMAGEGAAAVAIAAAQEPAQAAAAVDSMDLEAPGAL